MGAIGTLLLHDLINSGLIRWRLALYMDAIEKAGRKRARGCGADAGREAKHVSRDEIRRRKQRQGNICFPV